MRNEIGEIGGAGHFFRMSMTRFSIELDMNAPYRRLAHLHFRRSTMLITLFFIFSVFPSSTVKSTLYLPPCSGLRSDGTAILVMMRVPLCEVTPSRLYGRAPERLVGASRFFVLLRATHCAARSFILVFLRDAPCGERVALCCRKCVCVWLPLSCFYVNIVLCAISENSSELLKDLQLFSEIPINQKNAFAILFLSSPRAACASPLPWPPWPLSFVPSFHPSVYIHNFIEKAVIGHTWRKREKETQRAN